MKRKLSALEVNVELMNFLQAMETLDECEIASEYMLSQLSYLVGNLSKAKQAEFLMGLHNTLNEVK